MVKLTEEMVIARTRMSDFSAVKKLNCWGTELTDVTILRKMKNVEVLSLSVNNIDTLADFQYCQSLQDLFVRKNNIKDLNEVCYLQALPNLKNLWLGENPCAEKEGYRMAVLRALPNLEKLDDKVVTAEEVQTALARGKILMHPLDMVPGSEPGSPEEVANEFITVPEEEENRRYSSSSDQKSIDEAHDLQEEYHDTDRRNANYNASPPQHYPQNTQYGYELQNGQSKSQSKDDIVHQDMRNNGETVATNTLEIGKDYDDRSVISRNNTDYDERRAYSEYGSGEVPHRIYAPVSPRTQYSISESADDRRTDKNSYDYEERRQLEYEEPQHQLPAQSKRMSTQYNRDRDDPNQVPGWVRHSSKEKCRTQFHYHRRPVTRNSNILSAVLCLVKELDYPSLEVVEMAVRNRMDELEE